MIDFKNISVNISYKYYNIFHDVLQNPFRIVAYEMWKIETFFNIHNNWSCMGEY